MEYEKSYFTGKAAVVTGSASGIGLALVEALLQSGAAKVAMVDISPDNLNIQGNRLNAQYNGKVKCFLCDVTDEEQVQQMMEASVAFFGGRLDLLFNNAGALFSGWFDEVTNDMEKSI